MSEQAFTIFTMTYSIILPVIVTYVVNKMNKKSDKKDNMNKAVMLLLRSQLMQMHDSAMNKGYVTTTEYQTFEEIWLLYHDGFDGNCLTDLYHDEFKNLERR